MKPQIEKIQQVVNAFQYLADSDAQLLGSRFYGTATENSDYDYMILNGLTVIDTLEELGFERIPHEANGYVVDVCSKGIWRLEADAYQLDVQVVKDQFYWDIKMETSLLIRRRNIFKDITDKTVRSTIFLNILNSIHDEVIVMHAKKKGILYG